MQVHLVREGEGGGLVQVEESDSKQSEMNVQCEQIISTHPSSTTHQRTHIRRHSFGSTARCVRSQNLGTAK